MASLGTKKFWRPQVGASATQMENQIIKNSGYINIQLKTVNYMSVGNVWQDIFGGKDKIALATNLNYQSGVTSIEATSVQDVREVEVNHNYNLGLQRNIAVKIPANADAISLDVKMTAVKGDALQAKFDMLNKPEYQSALQLAPTVVGQVLTITSLVKKLFTDSDPRAQLEASYAGIISAKPEEHPVNNGKLTGGLLIMISTDDGDAFDDVDEKKFELRGDSLYYKGEEVENTYIIFNISFEPLKGEDQNSNWFKKYNDALNNLDKIQLTVDPADIAKIYNDSKSMWIEGNALIDADATYINSERLNIKGLAIRTLNDKYKELTKTGTEVHVASASDVIGAISHTIDLKTFKYALPATGSYLSERAIIVPGKPFQFVKGDKHDDKKLADMLDIDVDNYLKGLKANNLGFSFKGMGK